MRDQTEYEAVQAAETWLQPPDDPYPHLADEAPECSRCEEERDDGGEVEWDDDRSEWACRVCGKSV